MMVVGERVVLPPRAGGLEGRPLSPPPRISGLIEFSAEWGTPRTRCSAAVILAVQAVQGVADSVVRHHRSMIQAVRHGGDRRPCTLSRSVSRARESRSF